MTLFERIVAREIPADIIYEDELYLVFRDIHPQMTTHLLIIPKKPLPSFHLVQDQSDRLLVQGLMDIAWKIIDTYQLSGCKMVMNSGSEHGQEVMHIHLHLMSHDELTQ